jgi:hypothetical protein
MTSAPSRPSTSGLRRPVSILAGMHGQLRARSVADVCRELAEASATGVLHIAGIESAGRVVFDQGRLVAASSPTPGSRLGDRLVNGGLLAEEALEQVLEEQTDAPPGERARLGQLLVDRGLVPLDAVRLVVQEQLLDAVFDLVDWREGTYRFEADAEPLASEVPLAVPVDQALIEVSRRREEWESVSEVIPTLDSVPQFREGASTSTADLEPDEFAVMASVDGVRSVRDLAYDLGYGEFEAARVVYALSLVGLVEVAPPVDEIGAALDDALAYMGGQAASGTSREQAPGSADATEAPARTEGLDELTQAVADFDDPPDPAATPGEHREMDWSSSAEDEPELWSSLDELDEVDEVDATPGAAEATEATEPTPPTEPIGHETSDAHEDSAPERTLEADLPDLSGFEELRLADRDQQTAAPPEPAEAAPTAEAETSQQPTPQPPRHRSPTTADGDVSEFLRELSRLALDDEEEAEAEAPAASPPADTQPPAHQPPPRPRPAPEPRQEPKKKKRGLFGFGS